MKIIFNICFLLCFSIQTLTPDSIGIGINNFDESREAFYKHYLFSNSEKLDYKFLESQQIQKLLQNLSQSETYNTPSIRILTSNSPTICYTSDIFLIKTS